jgi:hypothetical protein
MVAAFDQARVEIEVKYVLISRCIAKEDSAKVVAVKLAATVTRAFHAYSGPKQFEVGKVWFEAIVSLEWCFPSFRVDEPIVKVDRVK